MELIEFYRIEAQLLSLVFGRTDILNIRIYFPLFSDVGRSHRCLIGSESNTNITRSSSIFRSQITIETILLRPDTPCAGFLMSVRLEIVPVLTIAIWILVVEYYHLIIS